MDRYEWHETDVKDHRHSLIYSLENALAVAKKSKLNVIQEVRLKTICRMKADIHSPYPYFKIVLSKTNV